MEQLARIAPRSEPLSRTSLLALDMFVETQKKRVQQIGDVDAFEELLHHVVQLLPSEERSDGDRRVVEREAGGEELPHLLHHRVGGPSARMTAGEDGAHAGAPDDVDRDVGFLESLEDTDVGDPESASAPEDDPHRPIEQPASKLSASCGSPLRT